MYSVSVIVYVDFILIKYGYVVVDVLWNLFLCAWNEFYYLLFVFFVEFFSNFSVVDGIGARARCTHRCIIYLLLWREFLIFYTFCFKYHNHYSFLLRLPLLSVNALSFFHLFKFAKATFDVHLNPLHHQTINQCIYL